MIRVGMGFDIHRMEKGRPCIIGGIEIPHETGPLGHSDGDVLLHALVDSMLGAAGAGDIGSFFPDTDTKFKNMDSRTFVVHTMKIIGQKGYK